MIKGGYEDGYRDCSCFWGTEPGSLIKKLAEFIGTLNNLNVLDVGCGEGKNAVYLASRGATVLAVDISMTAITNGRRYFPEFESITWKVADVLDLRLEVHTFDIVIAYGLFHCLSSADDVAKLINRLQAATKNGGFHVVCCFNSRYQDLSAHPGFNPILLSHQHIISYYKDWDLLHSSDSDLVETHPHNRIEHCHSMTRFIARRITK
jgi:cyclopropane fatty-acyl-phospholipid synthase-like methyltransferase